MAIQLETVIEAPIEQVFDVASNYRYTENMSHIEDIEVITDGPVGLNTGIKETRNIRGFKVENILKVTEYEPNKRFTVESQQHQLFVKYTYLFSEVDHGTKVEFIGKLKPSGIKNKLYKPFITKMIKKEDGDQLQAMKQYIEENAQ
ncbi:SRPBCC family protein [Allobacillus sp. GCM10007491]|uniref:SRPBCC family protein n=1 Tax=Allobacillus saliphilus TaxID=2912308 RepID=A0A941HT80_9BACI|nr:SRPBCC family protein [Allobacillus saliphilus]MBR7553687.1 SRPBCC family protein [Allobacillus saliphilus]